MLQSGLPDVVSDDEDLARFLTSSGWFNSVGPKPSAFLPSKDGETSTFRHDGNPPQELWAMFDEHVKTGTLHGAALVKAGDIRAADLRVAALEPPPRHAGIVAWPTDVDPVLQKAKQKERANLVASKAAMIKFAAPND